MKPLPQTKEEVKTTLREMIKANDLWHLDDDAIEIFGQEEGIWRHALVSVMNDLWTPNRGEEDCSNAGAWAALEDCCPELFDGTYWMSTTGDVHSNA